MASPLVALTSPANSLPAPEAPMVTAPRPAFARSMPAPAWEVTSAAAPPVRLTAPAPESWP